jgi:hypothetical protein
VRVDWYVRCLEARDTLANYISTSANALVAATFL